MLKMHPNTLEYFRQDIKLYTLNKIRFWENLFIFVKIDTQAIIISILLLWQLYIELWNRYKYFTEKKIIPDEKKFIYEKTSVR